MNLDIKDLNLYRLKLRTTEGEIFNQNLVAISPQSVLDYYYDEFGDSDWKWFGIEWLGLINEVLDYEEKAESQKSCF